MAGGSTGANPFPKWQIAVALGATGAIGLGYWYLKQQSAGKNNRTNLANTLNSMSIEDVNNATANETPFEKAQRFKVEGNKLFKHGKFNEAIAFYNKAIEMCPDNFTKDLAMFYQNRAAAYEQQSNWANVIEDCSKALELNAKYEKALYRRAKAYEIKKQWDCCLDDVTTVCLLQGFQNQNAIFMADRVLKELGKAHAAESMKSKKPRITSKQFVKTYFTTFSDDPVHKLLVNTDELLGLGEPKGFLKAKLAFATEKYDDVIAACTEELEYPESEHPESEIAENNASRYTNEALLLRATFHVLSGSHTDAMNDFSTIIKSNTASDRIKVNALIKRASLHMQSSDTDKCMDDLETAVKLGPNISDVYHHRGQMYLLMEKTEEARENFNKAVELNPNFPVACVQKCYADYRYATHFQDYELLTKTMPEFRKCLEIFPSCTEAYVLFAQVLSEKQEYEEAEKLYLKAMEIDPKNGTVLVHRGLLMLQWKGDTDQAVDFMKQAIKVDNSCEFAYETLGTVEVQRGNLVVAIDLFNKAIELAKSEIEMQHLYALRDAASSQLKISTKLGLGPKLLSMS